MNGWDDPPSQVIGQSRKAPAARLTHHAPRAVAAFDRDPAKAASRCFDRETGKPVHLKLLKSYAEALRRYHLHPDGKSVNANYTARGITSPRHVTAISVCLIGKEANRWEEQFHLGTDPETQAEYGTKADDRMQQEDRVRSGIRKHGALAVARQARLSRQHVANIAGGDSEPSSAVLAALSVAVQALDVEQDRQAATAAVSLRAIRRACERHGIRGVAQSLV